MFRFSATPITRVSASLAVVAQTRMQSWAQGSSVGTGDQGRAVARGDYPQSGNVNQKTSGDSGKHDSMGSQQHAEQASSGQTNDVLGRNSSFQQTSGTASREEIAEQKSAKDGYRGREAYPDANQDSSSFQQTSAGSKSKSGSKSSSSKSSDSNKSSSHAKGSNAKRSSS